jgi:hypothetical protein
VLEEAVVVGLLGVLMCRRMDSWAAVARTDWTVPGWRAGDPMGSVVSAGRPVK